MKTNELDDRGKSDWEGMQQQRDQKIIRGIETTKNDEETLTEPNSIQIGIETIEEKCPK